MRPRTLLILILASCSDPSRLRADAPMVPDAPGPPDAPVPDAPPDALPGGAWSAGALPEPLSPGGLLPLPGMGSGPPVVASNNPESFVGTGLLYGDGRASLARGGNTLATSGDFGVTLHHRNLSGAPRWITVMVENAVSEEVVVYATGSGYDQTDTGGLDLGMSPTYRVSEGWILESHNTLVPARTLAAGEAFALWQDRVPDGDQVDARFGVNATGPVHTYVVVTDSANLSDVLGVHQTDAPGALASLQAGVYEHDTWLGEILTEVPPGPAHVGFMVNTSSASGLSQVQAFPASVHYDDSASEAAGMYGNVYDLTIRLRHADGGAPRRVRAWFASLDETALPAYWDGVALVNSVPVVLRHTPLAKKTLLVQVVLSAGEEYVLTFRAMVPGLTTLPQALYLESE